MGDPNLDLGLEYTGGINKPTTDQIGRFAIVSLDPQGDPNLDYVSPVELSGLQTLRALGAKGDGSNDYAAVQAAITASAGKTLDGAGLTYKVNTPLTLAAGLTVQNATFDFSSIADGTLCMSASSTLATAKSLTSDAVYGTRTVQVASTTGILAGDFVLIRSTKLWASTGGGEIGEIGRVRTVDSGTQVTLETPLHSTYGTAQSATVARLNLEVQNVSFKNVRFIGAGTGHTQRLFQSVHCFNISFDRCRSDGFDTQHYEFYGSVNCKITKCYARESTAAGLSYGVVIQRGCKDVLVEGSTFSKFRHGVTIGGSAWVNRYIRVIGNHVDYCGDAGLDSHPMGQYVHMIGNTIVCNNSADWAGNTDGLICQSADPTIIGNTIVRPSGSGLIVQNFVTGAEEDVGAKISDNRIVDPGDIGIYVLNQGQTMRGVTVEGNSVRGARGSNGSVYLYALTGSIFNFSVAGNTLDNSLAPGVFVRGTSLTEGGGNINCFDGAVSGNAFHLLSGASSADGVLCQTVRRVRITGNVGEITNTGRHGINLSGCTDCSVSDNTIKLPTSSTGTGVLASGTCDGFDIHDNRVTGAGTGIGLSSTTTNCTIGVNKLDGCTAALSLSTGAGHKLLQSAEVSSDKGNAAFTVRHDSEQTILFNTPISADRAVTTPGANVKSRFRIVRGAGATGAFNVNVGTGPLKTLATAGTWCDVESNGTAFILTASGTL